MKTITKYCTLGALALLVGCAAPPLKFYTLSANQANITRDSTMSYSSTTPVIYVLQATVPDYLNTTDIVTRSQNTLNHSINGRMSSILSVGITELITQNLANKNPSILITNQTQIEPPTYQLMVNITRLDVQNEPNQEGVVTLEANWSIIPKDEKLPIQKKKAVFTSHGLIANDSDIIQLEQNVLMQLTNVINDNIHQLHIH